MKKDLKKLTTEHARRAKLVLRREAIATLTSIQLAGVGGGSGSVAANCNTGSSPNDDI
jgi:hypothetical protein